MRALGKNTTIIDIMSHMLKSVVALLSALTLMSCSSDGKNSDNYVVRVNDFCMSQADIDTLMKFEADLNSNFYTGEDVRAEFIQSLIQKQLLIQEAKKLHFDEREQFRQTIQRYWESTLIRDMLAEKTEQIRKSTMVSKAEVEAYYEQNKALMGESGIAEKEAELVKIVEEQKVTEQLQAWIAGLEKVAEIEITDKSLADKVKSIK